MLDFDTVAKQKIRDFISPLNMDRNTCACCNELNPPSKMHAVAPSGAWLACLQRKLKWEHTKYTVNEYTRNFYDVSDKIPALFGVPLAKEGIQERDGAYKVRSSLYSMNEHSYPPDIGAAVCSVHRCSCAKRAIIPYVRRKRAMSHHV